MRGAAIKVLVTGASGGLASALCPDIKKLGNQVIQADILAPNDNPKNFTKMDICDFKQVQSVFKKHKPKFVYHLAAMTDVDRCEEKPDLAYKINAWGTENIALACHKLNIPMVYISTAEVYDGSKKEPYIEYDQPGPVNTYAKSKLEGENIVKSMLNKYYIIRTAWMVGGGKKDKKFVTKIVQLLDTKKEIQVVNDKIGSPTFVKDLSHNLLKLTQLDRYGLYHMCNQGHCSRYELAQKVVQMLGRNDVKIAPVSSSHFNLRAPRGKSEAIINYKLDLLGLNLMPSWEASLKNYLKQEF